MAMKNHADRHRRDVHLQPGDLVYVRLKPYRQLSMRPHYSKLAKRFYGPYPITECVGPMAYRLQLPADSKIHPIFHVSLLKPHHGPPPPVDDPVPPTQVDHHPLVEPLSFLDWKFDTTKDPPSHSVLVQWRGLAPKDTSWKDWDALRSVYNLGDEVVFPREVVVSNKTQISREAPTKDRPKRNIKKPAHFQDYI
ncbi:uncharacterized protein [Glycine max]|uniref:uncharacterized protein n=1 Tax=Glycine max TaxID=3847 RepID=UPI000E21B3D7|nr:uncharacterized protein LOC113001654 [Glycine max]|eukprot:XP_025984334.1 uncharacterized protein LOC113001654 [Glycine max]